MSLSGLIETLNTTCFLTLQQTINKYVENQIPCKNIFMISLVGKNNEGVLQVIGDKILDEEFRFRSEYDLKLANVAEESNLALDNDLKQKMKLVLDPYPNYLLKVPVKHPERVELNCFIVFIVDPICKVKNDEYNYILFVKHCFESCSALLLNACNVMEENTLKNLHKKLLFIAKSYLLRIGDYNELLTEMIIETRHVMNAERCSLFLLSKDGTELIAKLFDGVPSTKTKEFRVPIHCGILGYVATNGEIVTVQNVQNHPIFYENVNQTSGSKTRNMLCFPIRNELNQVVAVAEICNKKGGLDFNYLDEEAASTLGIYVGIALVHSIVYRRMQTIAAQDRVATELVKYHLTTKDAEAERILNCTEEHKFEELFNPFWYSRYVDQSDTICFVLKMFDHLGFVTLWKISKTTLFHFVLAVRRSYRDLPYHNWAHAFSVAHFAFNLMTRLNLLRDHLITELEGMAFLVSSLCHDLDHRGTTNSFQVISESSLASLYSDDGSILERYHFSHTLTILNTENCNIFENLTVQQFSRVVCLIRDMILATDIAQHVKILPEERNLVNVGYTPGNRTHRSMLLSLMMTCCDLSDQVKGWSYCRSVADSVYAEFFAQGDKEKELGKVPLDMMDRDKAFIPKLQIEFLRRICIPCFTVLADIFPEVNVFVKAIEGTLAGWQKVVEWFQDNDILENFYSEYAYDPSLEAYVLNE